jgi:hypothetical protein
VNDERPLSETDPLVARLIESARRREPPREGLVATLEAVSAISTPASAPVPSRDTSNSTSPTSSFAFKAALGLGLCALLIGGPFVVFPEAVSPAGIRETDASPATFRKENSPPEVLREADDPSAAAVELRTPPPMTPLPAPEERPFLRPSIRVEDLPSAIIASPARPREAAQGSLADELAMLEQARTLLSAGQSGPCLSLLNRYAARYPNGAFADEAEVTRIEALQAAGEAATAAARARAFLARRTDSPHAGRVRSILQKKESQ